MPSLTLNPLSQAVCEGGSLTLSVDGTGTNPITYQWYFNGAAISGANSNTYSINPVSSTDGGNYVCILSNFCGSDTSSSALLTVFFPMPIANAGMDTTICEGESVMLIASGGTNYEWSPAADLDDAFIYNPIATPMSTTEYIVTVTDNNGCSSSDSVIVSLYPLPNVTITSYPYGTIFSGQAVTFTADPDFYPSYDFVKNNVSVQLGSSYTYLTYTIADGDVVSVIVKDTNGCKNTSNTISLGVFEIPSPTVLPPDKTFGDDMDLVIVNRWGQEIFSGTEGWDGTFNGAKVSPGTYFYIIKKYDDNGLKIATIKGSIMVLRD